MIDNLFLESDNNGVVVDGCVKMPFDKLNIRTPRPTYRQIAKIFPDLHFTEREWNVDNGGAPSYNHIYGFKIDYENKLILLPRNYDQYNSNIKNILDRAGRNKIIAKAESIPITNSITMRNRIQEESCKFIMDNEFGLLQLPPGKGKTVITIKAIAELKLKSLIIVDKTDIANQWRDRFIEFTSLTEDDITIYSNQNKDGNNFKTAVTIATIQSICRFKDGAESEEEIVGKINELANQCKEGNIGVAVVDEIHAIVGPELFSTGLYALPTKRLIGLSATPFRTDDRSILMQYWLGNAKYESWDYEVDPHIMMYYINSELSRTDIFRIYNHVKFDPTKTYPNGSPNWSEMKSNFYFDRHKYSKKLIESPVYCQTIADMALNFYTKKFPILILSVSKKLAEEIKRKIIRTVREKHTHIRRTEKLTTERRRELTQELKDIKADIGVFMGTAKIEETQKMITIATIAKCVKAIDAPHWQTLIMATPIAGENPDLIQAIGRICRSFTYEDGRKKEKAMIIDIIDTSMEYTIHRAMTRKETYVKNHFIIHDKHDLHWEDVENLQSDIKQVRKKKIPKDATLFRNKERIMNNDIINMF